MTQSFPFVFLPDLWGIGEEMEKEAGNILPENKLLDIEERLGHRLSVLQEADDASLFDDKKEIGFARRYRDIGWPLEITERNDRGRRLCLRLCCGAEAGEQCDDDD